MEILKSTINNVIVYSDRAQITRFAKISLSKGENTVVFADLPENIDEKSIQVKGLGDAVLNDIKFKKVFHNQIQNDAVKELFDKIEEIQKKLNVLDENINIEQKELDFVEKIVSKTTHLAEKETVTEELNPEKWIKMVDFYRQKNEMIAEKLREYKYKKKELSEKITVLQSEINLIGNDKNKTSNQVEVVVTNNSESEIIFSLTYVVYGASWSPLYDIRVSSENKNVVIEYKAQITQNTGESWDDVKLSISTAQVNVSGNIPELEPWHLSFYVPKPTVSAKSDHRKRSVKMKKSIIDSEMDNMMSMSSGSIPPPLIEKPKAKVKTGATSVLFEIPTLCTIKNDNQAHKVNIIIEELSAELTYAVVPKLSQYAFLTAKIKNTSDYPFLPGETNIFLDGSFVASSNLKLVVPSEEFETSLGIDEGIKVDYKLIKKYEKNKGLVSKKNNIVFEYKTVIINNKKHKYKFVAYDQLPISEHENIKIEMFKPDYKEDTDTLKMNNQNKIEWHFELESGAENVIDFNFSVESPKDKTIEGI